MNDFDCDSITELEDAVKNFMESQNQILVLSGMFAQCMRGVVDRVSIILTQINIKAYTVIVPAARMSRGYDPEINSVYGLIYEKKAHFHKKEQKFIHDKRTCNQDSPCHVYILGEAHLISDSLYETSSRRFGSGHLLSDLMEFISLGEIERKIIFIGDPYQLSRGSSTHALSVTKLREYSESVKHVQIKKIKCTRGSPLFLENRELIAERIRTHQFSRLNIKLDESECIQLFDASNEIDELVKDDVGTIVAYTNAQVNRYNQTIRKRVFGRESMLSVGDLVELRNQIEFCCSQCPCHGKISNGSFGTVMEIANKDTVRQNLKGRMNPITVNFLELRIRWKDSACPHDQTLLCFEDFLYREKPELGKDEFLALVAHARNGAKPKDIPNDQKGNTELVHNTSTPTDESSEQSKDEKNDKNGDKEDIDSIYLRAAMLRFGYAMTLHRAQGRLFRMIIADLSEKTTMGGETYFRWLNTAFSVPDQRLYLLNVPRKSPFDKTIWQFDKSRLVSSIQPANLIGYDPSTSNPDQIIQFPTDHKELCNLYEFIRRRLNRISVQISELLHHQYQEVYTFETDDQSRCTLQLHYNQKFEVTKIQVRESRPPDFVERIMDVLSSKPVFHDSFQQEVYEILYKKLNSHDIVITGVEHHDFQETYIVEGSEGKAKLRTHYNKYAAVTKIILAEHSSTRFLNHLKSIIPV